MLSIFSGSRGPDGPDLPSPFGRKFQLQFTREDDSDLVADVDPDTLIHIVLTELKNGKAPGIDNVYNLILKKAIGTGFYKVLS